MDVGSLFFCLAFREECKEMKTALTFVILDIQGLLFILHQALRKQDGFQRIGLWGSNELAF